MDKIIHIPNDGTLGIPSTESPRRSGLDFVDLTSGKTYATSFAYGVDGGADGPKAVAGTLRISVESSETTAGVRRLLVRAEVPVFKSTSGDGASCCCTTAPSSDSKPEFVTAHTVITVPASVAKGLLNGDPVAKPVVGTAIRALCSAMDTLLTPDQEIKEITSYDTQLTNQAVVYISDAGSAQITVPVWYKEGGFRIFPVAENAGIYTAINGVDTVS